MTHSSRVLGLGVLLAGLALPGCVVSDIHDEMVQTNGKLDQLDHRLALIERANRLLDDGNTQLIAVHARLERMESINQSLDSIDASLKHLDAHLLSLRGTIERIPFVGGDEDAAGEENSGIEDTAAHAESLD